MDKGFRVLSRDFRVRTNLPEAAEILDHLLAHFWSRRPREDAPTYELRHQEGGERPYVFYINGEYEQDSPSLGSALNNLLGEIHSRVILETQGYLMVHGAAASCDGRAVLLPAPPDSGKTTTVAGLVKAGFSYLTDEAALIDPRDGWLHPYPRSLWMEEPSFRMFPHLQRQIPREFIRLMTVHYHVSPNDLRSDSIGRAGPIRYVVAPFYAKATETVLEPASRIEGLMSLVENSFNFHEFGAKGLRLLGDVVKGADCYRLRIGDLDSAVRLIQGLFAADKSGGNKGREVGSVSR